MLDIDGRPDGAISADGRIAGCYLHGLFASDAFRTAFLASLGAAPSDLAYEASIERTLDALAAHLAATVDLDRMLAIAQRGASATAASASTAA
jgi:adenosylcobyric acid synthase